LGGAGGSTFKLQGSQNNSSWNNVYTSGMVGTTGTVVDVTSGIDTSTAYRYHRIDINGKELTRPALRSLSSTPTLLPCLI
jgi:hypothetical protein